MKWLSSNIVLYRGGFKLRLNPFEVRGIIGGAKGANFTVLKNKLTHTHIYIKFITESK